jgi:hypothetical protein
MRTAVSLASWKAWGATRGRSVALVLAVGLGIAAPFWTPCGLGTHEAYNYSLAVADGVTQMRAGIFPVLVGQTAYAWNGRVHPLRTAPYLVYLAGALDLVTGRTLGFWMLQNLVVGLSLFAGVGSCYLCLRRAIPELSPGRAALLAAAYGLSPGLLSTAYAMDLYMTVMTAPWIPVVLGGLIRARRVGSFGAYAQVAVGLAACWLAHPPVAFWLSAACVPAGLVILAAARPRRRALLAAAGAALLFLLLAGFGLVSALTVQGYHAITHVKDIAPLLHETRRAFGASLRPVSARADQLGDFQLGYAYWALLAIALVLAVRRRHALALAFVGAGLGFLALTLPVPGVQAWLWERLPTLALTLTNQWPMQRLYLLVTALAVFACALGWRPSARPPSRFRRELLQLLFAASVLWTGWEALHFLSRGFTTRLAPDVSRQVHQPENIDLTVTSFALLGTPPWFVNGVMDPAMEFRLREPGDVRVVTANATAPWPDRVAAGSFRVADTGPNRLTLAPTLTLEPGRRYRLSFDFKIPPQPLILQLRGRGFFREYTLPMAGGAEGFGLASGASHSLSLWTTGKQPVTVELWLVAPGIETQNLDLIADFRLEAARLDQLPVVLESLAPLRVRVRAAAAGYLETPRLFLPGYAATVDGRPVPVQASPDRLVLVPVPAGTSEVTIRYPGPFILRLAFWLTSAAWAGVLLALVLPAGARRRMREAGRSVLRRRPPVSRRAVVAAMAGIALGVLAYGGISAHRRWRAAVGPVVMNVIFPRDFWQGTQPLLVTGRPHAGTFIFVRYVDSSHVRIGVDVWGIVGTVSAPVATDYYAVHRIEISTGALFPLDNPAVRALPAAERDRLRRQVRVTLDGRTVLDLSTRQYDTTLSEITVGDNLIGGSNAGVRFTGRILSVGRAPPGS